MKVNGELWYGDGMIPLAKSGDQRSTKEEIKKGKTCEIGKF